VIDLEILRTERAGILTRMRTKHDLTASGAMAFETADFQEFSTDAGRVREIDGQLTAAESAKWQRESLLGQLDPQPVVPV
jgi:hypothetical protein